MNSIYRSNLFPLSGNKYNEIVRKARTLYKHIASKTKRKPYVRSAYFNKEKVFLDYFWQHLEQKNWGDRLRRLRFYNCAIDLILHTRTMPSVTEDTHNKSGTLFRFKGVTKDNELFFVQIKRDSKGNKH